MTADLVPLARRLRRELGTDAVVTDEAARRTYECDGLTHYRVTPGVVVLPSSAEQVRFAVRECADAGVPFVARGAGTGLSGGALPVASGVLIVTSRMRRILDVDLANQRAIVEPGVANLAISQAVQPSGYFYAPDPSSQVVCTIGGNVAENSGGAHCVKYGFTVHHVQAAYLSGTLEPNCWVDISDTLERKIDALFCHASQLTETGEWFRQFLRDRAEEAGREAGVAYAEGFRRLSFGG